MLAVNFHLMGGMPAYPAPAGAPSAAGAALPTRAPATFEAVPAAGVATPSRSGFGRGTDAAAEVVLRRPIALQMLLTKVRENLA